MNGMVAVRFWLLLLLAYTGYNSYAQPKNDSVFSAAKLSSIPLGTVQDAQTGFTLPSGPAVKPRVFVFLSPECPLCQNYTSLLNKLNTEYAGRIELYGIIPGKTYSRAVIAAFAKKYKVNYPLLIDESLAFSKYLQAEITPEAVFLDAGNLLVYRGALDNWLSDLGKRRATVTETFLLDAVDRNLRQQPVARKRNKAVGCLINDY
jgi:thiol-disulfide isomerase/thioredoxin